MPKMKTNRAAAKRFKISASGRVRRPKGGANHFMGSKRPNRLRRLRKNDMVHEALEKRVLQMFPYGLK
jgi:large subunit ribosomal protein L35